MSIETLKTYKLCYLGTPYTKYKAGRRVAFEDATIIAAKLTRLMVPIYSPVVHGHPLSEVGGLDPVDKNWNAWNWPMVCKSDALVIGILPGWDESDGLAHEIGAFRKHEKPIFALDPATMDVWFHEM